MNTEKKQLPTLTDVSAINGQYSSSSVSCEPSDASCSPEAGCRPY